MKTIIKTAVCLGAGLLMTFGQSESIGSVANAAPQHANSQSTQSIGDTVIASPPPVAIASQGCDANCAAGNCQSGCDSLPAQGFGGGCNQGCSSGQCGCSGGRLGARLGHRLGGRNVCCPECSESFLPQEYCDLEVTKGEVEKTCFEVGFKTICIPKIVPPWKDPCAPKCAEARSVKVLKKKKYKCPACKYSWKVVKPELPAPPTAQPVPSANNDYYIPAPTHRQPLHATPARHQLQSPQPPAIGSPRWNGNQAIPQVQPGMPLPSNIHPSPNQQYQVPQNRQPIPSNAFGQLRPKGPAANEIAKQTGQKEPVAKQAKAGGTLSDYYR